ncbi:MAG: hypothetical protein II972_02375 [Elusimicrobiaceae bacterium]|nr:hypothetical protein [Elusimicrobiaceae bacterium]
MKQISSSLTQALNSQTPKYYKKILLYKRVWNSATSEYEFEPPIDISKHLIEISPIKWKLDTEAYSTWSCANTSLVLNNLDKKFTPGAQNSYFAEEENFFGSKVEVFGGANTSEGKEDILIFRGFILNTPQEYPEDKTISLTLKGELEKLSSFSAEQISNLTKNELLGQNEGQEFYTINSGVGVILEVKQGSSLANTQTLQPSLDYQVSSLNNLNQGAKIKLKNTLAEGQSLWCSYIYWWQNKPLSWLAGQIAQISNSQNTDIDDVSFDHAIINTFEQPTFTTFEEGTLENVEISSNTVQLKNNFLKDAEFAWTILEKPSNVSFTFTPTSAWLSSGLLSSPATAYTPSAQAYGTWQIDASCNWSETENQLNFFISSTNNYRNTNGYCLTHFKYGNNMVFGLYKVNNGTLVGLHAASYSLGSNITKIKYRLSRDENGNFYLWLKALEPSASSWHYLGLVATDNTYTQSSYLVLKMVNNGYQGIENVSLSPQAATGTGNLAPKGTYLSPVIDGGEYLINWDVFNINQTLNLGSAKTFWRAKDTLEDSWTEWAEITSSQTPATQKRYLQLKWSATSNAEQTSSPVLNNWSLVYYTNSVNIALVNTYQKNCLEIMQDLALLSGFIIGYKTDGTFLFKKRTYPEPSLTLTKGEIINIEYQNSGIDKLFNRVCVNFGTYQEVKDNSLENLTRPNLIDKYGLKELKISAGTLLPPENANLALAAVSAIYEQVCQVKKRAVINTKFLPQIELGDTLLIDYANYLETEMSVEGLEFDLENWTLRLDLKEI